MKDKQRRRIKQLDYTAICINELGEDIIFRKRYRQTWLTINMEHEKVEGYVTPIVSEFTKKKEVYMLDEALEILEHDLEELNNVEP